ncbi:MAG: hypothetical protein Q7J34_01765 [Bacteroidales bacterium]|nr:hypothetical protein [Bacteroidales bacterium]
MLRTLEAFNDSIRLPFGSAQGAAQGPKYRSLSGAETSGGETKRAMKRKKRRTYRNGLKCSISTLNACFTMPM